MLFEVSFEEWVQAGGEMRLGFGRHFLRCTEGVRCRHAGDGILAFSGGNKIRRQHGVKNTVGENTVLFQRTVHSFEVVAYDGVIL